MFLPDLTFQVSILNPQANDGLTWIHVCIQCVSEKTSPFHICDVLLGCHPILLILMWWLCSKELLIYVMLQCHKRQSI